MLPQRTEDRARTVPPQPPVHQGPSLSTGSSRPTMTPTVGRCHGWPGVPHHPLDLPRLAAVDLLQDAQAPYRVHGRLFLPLGDGRRQRTGRWRGWRSRVEVVPQAHGDQLVHHQARDRQQQWWPSAAEEVSASSRRWFAWIVSHLAEPRPLRSRGRAVPLTVAVVSPVSSVSNFQYVPPILYFRSLRDFGYCLLGPGPCRARHDGSIPPRQHLVPSRPNRVTFMLNI